MSIATVSKVVNGKSEVSPDTRALVEGSSRSTATAGRRSGPRPRR
ncbi:hypothetical protein [Paractinoplanes durhamensis]